MSLFCDRNCDGIITSQIQIRQWPQYVWFSRFDFTQRFETRGHCIALEIGGEVISFVLCHLDGKRSSGVFGGGGVYFGGIWGPWGIFDRFGIGDITLHLHSGGIWGVFERSEMGPIMAGHCICPLYFVFWKWSSLSFGWQPITGEARHYSHLEIWFKTKPAKCFLLKGNLFGTPGVGPTSEEHIRPYFWAWLTL